MVGCVRMPPPSQFPNARAALERVRTEHSCSRALRAEAKLDYFDDQDRVRVSAFFMTQHPRSVRFDLVSPFGTQLATLTSDGASFALLDQKEKAFYVGAANQCNVEQFLRVPVPPEALIQLLGGEMPILVHEPDAASLNWEDGAYVVEIRSRHDARERIVLEPLEADWERPYSEQRLRVREVTVTQGAATLYHAELDDYRVAPTAPARRDPEGIEPDLPPSGPMCRAEVPHRLRFQVPLEGRDVLFEQRSVEHNPPMLPGVFTQAQPGGTKRRPTNCR